MRVITDTFNLTIQRMFGSDDAFLLQTTEQGDTDCELALGLHPGQRASEKRASHHGTIYLKHDNIWSIL